MTSADTPPAVSSAAITAIVHDLNGHLPETDVVREGPDDSGAALREEAGKDIWLFGGGQLFRSQLEAKLVDTVEVAVIPVLLGGGVALLPPPVVRASLKLTKHRIYEQSGIALLEYTID